MKNLLLITICLSLTSCEGYINVRTRTINDNDIIIINGYKSLYKGLKVGDTIQLKRSSYTWVFENGPRTKDGFTSGSYIGSDSVEYGYFIEYKQAIIEEIDCK